MSENRLPTVLVIATTFPRYKNDSEPAFVYNLSKRLAKKGFKISVLVPGAPGALSYEEMDGLKVYRFPYFFPKKLQKVCYDGGALPNLKSSWLARVELPFFLFFQFLHIGRIIIKEKISMIHCHWIIPQGFFCAIYKKIFKIPFVLTVHAGDVFFLLSSSIFKPFGKFAVSQSVVCCANSNAIKNAVLELYKKNIDIKIVPMGVDLKIFNGQQPEQAIKIKYGINGPLLLAVGRFAEKKGFKYLIEAMPLIIEKYPETKLLIIGFGPLEKSLKELAKKLNTGNSIIFPGKMSSSELAKYFAISDVFVGPSIVDESGDTEGLGVVFLEALASRIAVVASRVGGITDFIIDNETGLLVNQKDPYDLAEKTMKLLGDDELRKKIADKGNEAIEKKFSWETISSEYSSIYKEALANE